jgi:hypothetical protein
MSAFSVATACVQRIDQGEGPAVTFEQALSLVEHPLTGLSRHELTEVVAYLACQVVGYQHSQNADAKLAMSQIETIVAEFQKRAGRAA